jgi:8-oxo-dGTP diphosphatase
VTVDLVVFVWKDGALRTLLIKRRNEPFAGKWAIPGGFMEMAEPVEQAARRELREETGLEISGTIETIGFFGKPGRDPRGRTITLAHAAVLGPGNHTIQGGDDAAAADWVELPKAKDLAFDHDEIVGVATQWLRRGVLEGALAGQVLAPSFTREDVRALLTQLGCSRQRARTWLSQRLKTREIVWSDEASTRLRFTALEGRD